MLRGTPHRLLLRATLRRLQWYETGPVDFVTCGAHVFRRDTENVKYGFDVLLPQGTTPMEDDEDADSLAEVSAKGPIGKAPKSLPKAHAGKNKTTTIPTVRKQVLPTCFLWRSCLQKRH